jgi:hypothetical protein
MPTITIVAKTGFLIDVRVIHICLRPHQPSFIGGVRRLAKGGGPMRNRVERGVSFPLPNRLSFGRRAPRITHAG